MKLSIIIPTFEEENYLPILFKSLKAQTYTDYEVIVADNKSADETIHIADEYGAVVVPGGMPGKGRNCGAAIAKGDLLLFLDADVVIPPTFLADIVAEFYNRGLDIATCQILPLSDRKMDIFLHQVYNYFIRLTQSFAPFAPGFCILVDRKIHTVIGGFDEGIFLGEDSEYVKRAARLSKFGVLLSHKVPVSVRRLDRDGRWNVCMKYILSGIYMSVIGDIRTNLFNYTFGHNEKK
jgi:glycosyltransferase involved in cell wall biosynthesis